MFKLFYQGKNYTLKRTQNINRYGYTHGYFVVLLTELFFLLCYYTKMNNLENLHFHTDFLWDHNSTELMPIDTIACRVSILFAVSENLKEYLTDLSTFFTVFLYKLRLYKSIKNV